MIETATPAARRSLAARSLRATLAEIADGFRLVRANPCLWGTRLGASLSLLAGAGANVVWGSLMMTLVPDELRGRVSSFDWLVSIGLIPLSFAITGPIASALGPMTTLLGAGCLGGAAMIAFLAVPGVRDPERSMSTGPSR